MDVRIASLLGILYLTASVGALSQNLVDATRVPEEWRDFEPSEDSPKLSCRVSTIKPKLNYSFRFQTGFVVHSSLRQFTGKRQRLAIFFRVTPEDQKSKPSYFLRLAYLPEVPETSASLEIGGGFVVGEGKYRVDLMLTDESGRTCHRDWKITAKLGRKEDDVPPGMPAGAVDEISLRKWTRGSRGADLDEGYRVTVLMNASPAAPNRTRLGGYDRILLLSSLASLVERLPLRAVRLIVFSPDQQREIYRENDFEPRDFGRLGQALGQLELGTVDYEVLKNRRGHADLVRELIDEALKEHGSDAVVFLGPKPWYFDRVELPSEADSGSGQPLFFYVQLRPLLMGAVQPDMVMGAVKRMGGRTFEVFSPGDFASAIRHIVQALQTSRQSSNRQSLRMLRGSGGVLLSGKKSDQEAKDH